MSLERCLRRPRGADDEEEGERPLGQHSRGRVVVHALM